LAFIKVFSDRHLREISTGGIKKMKQQEAKYKDLIKTLPDIVYIIDTDGYFTYLNDSVKRLGYTPDQLIGKHFSTIIHPDEIEKIQRSKVLPRLKGIVTSKDEIPLLFDEKRTGTRITRNLRVRLLPRGKVKRGFCTEGEVIAIGLYEYEKEGDKSFIGTIGLIRDIGEIKRTRRAMLLTEKHYRLLIENTSEVISVIANDGTILYESDSIVRILGYQPIDITGENVLTFIHPDDIEVINEILEEKITFSRQTSIEYRFRHSKGSWRFHKAAIRRIEDDTNTIMCFILNSRDETDSKVIEIALKDSEKKYRELVESLPEIVFELDTKGRFSYINRRATELLGYTPEEFSAINVLDIVNRDEREQVMAGITRTLDGERAPGEKYSFVRKDGSTLDVEVYTNQIYWNGEVAGVRGIAVDVTDIMNAEKALRRSKEKYRELYESAQVGMVSADLTTGLVIASNDLGYMIFGHKSKYDLIGESLNERFVDSDAMREMLEEIAVNREVHNREIQFKRIDDSTFWAKISAKAQPEKGIVEYVIIDITKKKEAEGFVYKLTFYDPLTELPNKDMFKNRLQTEIMKSGQFAVMCVGIDKFKSINDMYGLAVGDKLLQGIASKIKKMYFKRDLVSRFEGDKFMILLSDIGNPDHNMDVDKIDRITQKTHNIFSDTFTVDGNSLEITSCIGLCLYPNDGDKAESLMKNCVSAMYMAKEQGRNTSRYFDAWLNEEMMNRLKLERAMRSAISNDEFKVHFQPKVDKEGQIIGMESLIRWRSPERDGFIPPLEFIPLAENSGLIVDIGYSILKKSCEYNRRWQDLEFAQKRVAVNLSPFQFKQPDLIPNIRRILDETGLEPEWLELEITESGIMENEEENIQKLNEMHTMGISISIDDFGTGYSSLSKLKDYPIDTLKIDKSFVDDLPDNSMSATIAMTIIDLAHHLGFKVVAEGVETKEQLDFLNEQGCDQFQGYYFCEPLAPDRFEEKLKKS
jgi:diguanylate cyclase (GGDEF)-like protein/PAS domain S-box-containing protein